MRKLKLRSLKQLVWVRILIPGRGFQSAGSHLSRTILGFRDMGSPCSLWTQKSTKHLWSSLYSSGTRYITGALLPHGVRQRGKYESAWKGLGALQVQSIVYPDSSGDRATDLQNRNCINALRKQQHKGFPENHSFPGTVELQIIGD